MKFINRHVLVHAAIVLIATTLLYVSILKLPGDYRRASVFITVGYMLIVGLSALLNSRSDMYQGYFGLNYHAVTYIICIGLPLLLKAGGLLPDVSFVGSMALSWGVGLAAHLLIFLFLFRKRRIGNYDKEEIFE